MHITHTKNVGNSYDHSNEWMKEGVSPMQVYKWGLEHKDPSSQTIEWSKTLRMTTYGVLFLFIITLLLNGIQMYQTNKIITQLAQLEVLEP